MSTEITGRVVQIFDMVSGKSRAGKDWQKQEFIVETGGQYPKKVCFTTFGDKVQLLSGVYEQDEVTVAFDPESREYNGRWYTELRAWKISRGGQAEGEQPAGPSRSARGGTERGGAGGYEKSDEGGKRGDDLPF